MSTLGLILLLVAVHSNNKKFCEGTVTWSYADPESWGNDFPTCNGTEQSPINIVSMQTTMNNSLGPFNTSVAAKLPSSMVLKNNGHAIQVDLEGGYTINDEKFLPSPFKAAQFHFHWGGPSKNGSEHTLDGAQSFAEIHIVHYNTKYDSLGLAADKSDGLAVFGYCVADIKETDNADFDQVLKYISNGNVQYKDDSYTLPDVFSVQSLLPSGTGSYYRYRGSLTTPGCHESVVWTVFTDIIQISPAQANILRSMVFEETSTDGSSTPLINNNRPVQPVGQRTVERSMDFSGAWSTFSAPIFNLLAAVSLANIAFLFIQ